MLSILELWGTRAVLVSRLHPGEGNDGYITTGILEVIHRHVGRLTRVTSERKLYSHPPCVELQTLIYWDGIFTYIFCDLDEPTRRAACILEHASSSLSIAAILTVAPLPFWLVSAEENEVESSADCQPTLRKIDNLS